MVYKKLDQGNVTKLLCPYDGTMYILMNLYFFLWFQFPFSVIIVCVYLVFELFCISSDDGIFYFLMILYFFLWFQFLFSIIIVYVCQGQN